MINFAQCRAITNERLDSQFSELDEYCREYPELIEFVDLIVYPMINPTDIGKEDSKTKISTELTGFIYDINKCDLRSNMTNPYHFQANWVYNLNNFIGNWFLDDFSFSVKQNGYWGCWKIVNDPEQDGSQDPQVMILAAKENVNHHEKLSENVELFRNPATRNMISSGIVEAQLALEKIIY